MQKQYGITWYFPEILMTKELCNWIGREAQLAITNQKRESQMLPSLGDSLRLLPSLDLHAKNPRHFWISSNDIDDQRILQYGWTRGTTGITLPKEALSDATFTWLLSPCKKSKRLLDSFQRYWCSKNPAFWLDKRFN